MLIAKMLRPKNDPAIRLIYTASAMIISGKYTHLFCHIIIFILILHQIIFLINCTFFLFLYNITT